MSLKPYKYNFPDIKRGDSYNGAELTCTNTTTSTPIDLTSASIKMQLKKCGMNNVPFALELSTANGLITITDAINGEFQIGTFKMNIEAGQYDYDLQFTFSGDIVKTYMYGKWNVINDITR